MEHHQAGAVGNGLGPNFGRKLTQNRNSNIDFSFLIQVLISKSIPPDMSANCKTTTCQKTHAEDAKQWPEGRIAKPKNANKNWVGLMGGF